MGEVLEKLGKNCVCVCLAWTCSVNAEFWDLVKVVSWVDMGVVGDQYIPMEVNAGEKKNDNFTSSSQFTERGWEFGAFC